MIKFNSTYLQKAVVFETLETALLNLVQLYPSVEVSISVDEETKDVKINLGSSLEYIIPNAFDDKTGRIFWKEEGEKKE